MIQAIVIQALNPHVVEAPVNLNVKKDEMLSFQKIINSGLENPPLLYQGFNE